MAHITTSNAKTLQKQSWASRKANRELRGLLLPLGLWDAGNGKPYARSMRRVLGLGRRTRRFELSHFARQNWEPIERALLLALQNRTHALWACNILRDLEKRARG